MSKIPLSYKSLFFAKLTSLHIQTVTPKNNLIYTLQHKKFTVQFFFFAKNKQLQEKTGYSKLEIG